MVELIKKHLPCVTWVVKIGEKFLGRNILSYVIYYFPRPRNFSPRGSHGSQVHTGTSHALVCRQTNAIPLTIIHVGNITRNNSMSDNDI